MKKFLNVGIVVVIVAALVAMISWFMKPAEKNENEKEIKITLVDCTKEKEQVIFDQNVSTEVEDLFALLEELNKEDVLTSVLEESQYGPLLVQMEECKQDMDKGPWLVYESKNNKVCKEQGMCPVLDQVVLEDGDEFTFKFITSF